MSNSITYIYGLMHPLSKYAIDVRYIGKTLNPKNRLDNHLRDAKKGINRPVCNWIRRLSAKGLKPKMVIYEEVPTERWKELEIMYIDYFKHFVKRELLNISVGGDDNKNTNNLIKKKLAKYNLHGELLKVYTSMREGARDSNVDFVQIHNSINKHSFNGIAYAKGFLWCNVAKGVKAEQKIFSYTELKQYKKPIRIKYCKPKAFRFKRIQMIKDKKQPKYELLQYSLSGELLNTYYSYDDALKAIGSNRVNGIKEAIAGYKIERDRVKKILSYKGFIWKKNILKNVGG